MLIALKRPERVKNNCGITALICAFTKRLHATEQGGQGNLQTDKNCPALYIKPGPQAHIWGGSSKYKVELSTSCNAN